MALIVATARIEDAEKWETGFRTHGDLFRSQTVRGSIHFHVSGNEVTILFEADDLDSYLQGLESEATAEAMAFDGINRETVKIAVLDRQFDV